MDIWVIKDGFPLRKKNPFVEGRESYRVLNEEYSRSFLWWHLASVIISSRQGNQEDGRWNLSLPGRLPHYLIEIEILSPLACLSRFFSHICWITTSYLSFKGGFPPAHPICSACLLFPCSHDLVIRVMAEETRWCWGEKEGEIDWGDLADSLGCAEFERGAGLKQGRTSYEWDFSQRKGAGELRTLGGWFFSFSSPVPGNLYK